MPPILSTSKALCSFVWRKNGLRQLVGLVESNAQLRISDQGRFLNSIAGRQNRHFHKSFSSRNHSKPFIGCLLNNNSVQTRQFLGCGDGEEGVLSKVYEERRVLG